MTHPLPAASPIVRDQSRGHASIVRDQSYDITPIVRVRSRVNAPIVLVQSRDRASRATRARFAVKRLLHYYF